MIQFETTVNGKTLTFHDDHLNYAGRDILFSEISDIAKKAGDTPAMVFSYRGKRIALPYPSEDEKQVMDIFRKIHIQNKSQEKISTETAYAENINPSVNPVSAEYANEPHSEIDEPVKTSRAARKSAKKQNANQNIDFSESGIPAKNKGFWSVGRLVIGIISMVLSLFVMFQSCAAGIANTLSESGDVGGTAGLITAIMLLAAGIVAVASRNSKKRGGPVAVIILYAIAAVTALANCAVYKDLMVWGIMCICFAIVFAVCVIKHKN